MRRLAPTAITALIIAAATPARAATIDCSELGTVRSQNSGELVVVNFHNATAEPRQLKWIDVNGEPVDYVTIQPNRRVGQPIGTGDFWMIASEAGDCLFLYATEASESFEITN